MSKKEHINFAAVSKDAISFAATEMIVQGLLKTGQRVRRLIEGVAIEKALALGFMSDCTAIGMTKPAEEAWDALLRVGNYQGVIVGTSSPMHAERLLALAANRLGIPVFAYPDTWGAESRLGSDVKVAQWFTIDQTHASLIGAHAIVIGDPAYEATVAPPKNGARTRLKEYGNTEDMLLIVGQGFDYLDDVLMAAIELLVANPTLRLVPKLWHPKKRPGPEITAKIEEKLGRLGDRVIKIDQADEAILDTDTLAKLCGTTISVFTTVLRIAATNSNRAISVHSPKTMTGMKKSTSLDYYPPASPHGPIYRWDYNPANAHFVDLNNIPRGTYEPVRPDVKKAVGTIIDIIV